MKATLLLALLSFTMTMFTVVTLVWSPNKQQTHSANQSGWYGGPLDHQAMHEPHANHRGDPS